jgi:protease-4
MTGQFLRGTLDKLGVAPEFGARKEFKTAPQAFTETEFTAEGRQTTDHILNTLHAIMVKDIAHSRNMDEAVFSDIVTNGPYNSDKALELKLVTGLAYQDQLYENILVKKFNVDSANKLNLLYLTKYASSVGARYRKGKQGIAVIQVFGGISVGETQGRDGAGSNTVIRGIRQAVQDKAVKAILLHVDSPGGSYIASGAIPMNLYDSLKY